jgi:hypothetical protein
MSKILLGEIGLIKTLDLIIEEEEIDLGLSTLKKVPDCFSRYDKYMGKILDLIIEKGDFKLALNTLKEVRVYFSRYNEYLEKVGSLIK